VEISLRNILFKTSMTRLFIFIFILGSNKSIFSQCIDKEKIKYGGDWAGTEYIHLCPTYSFAFGGDTSTRWNVLDPVDISLAPKTLMPIKHKVEMAIKKFAGNEFYSKIKFYEVEIVFENKLKALLDSGMEGISMKNCKAKYYFSYYFTPDSLTSYHIGIAVNKSEAIISPFLFPSKREYLPIDKTFSYCKILEIARKVQKDIDPIEEIQFQFDSKSKRFYWLVIEQIKNQKEGLNYLNEVEIDAADLTKTKLIKAKVEIVY
jgi:hypothetical protein